MLLAFLFPPLAHASGQVTFEDVAPILFKNCTVCHHEGGSGPFNLTTYRDVQKRAKQIASLVSSRYMPPWLPEPGYGDFAEGRRLTEKEIGVIEQWAAQGAAEGRPNSTVAAPNYAERWELGKPDLILQMPKPYVLPAQAGEGRDVFRNFVLPVTVDGPRYVRAVELRPGNPKIFHHANILVDRSGTVRKRQATPDAGFEGMDLEIESESFDPDSHFLSWKPGSVPSQGSPDMSWRVDPGTDLVVNLHMRPDGKPEQVQVRLGLYFSDKPPTRFPMLLQLESDRALNIQAGAREFVAQDDFSLPMDVEVLAVYPHAHYLGKTLDGYAILPGGEKRWLIRIQDWNLDWQGVFRYAKPLFLPKGSTVHMRWTYDNSAGNVRNPNHPPRRVGAGNQATDEMSHLWLQVLPVNVGGLKVDPRLVLQEAMMRHRARGDPDDYVARYNLGSALQILGRLDEAAAEYRRILDLRPSDPVARNSLGTVLRLQGKTNEAMAEYHEVLRLHPGYTDAEYNVGRVYLSDGKLEQASESFAAVLHVQPWHADARHSLGVALQLEGKTDDAIREYREVLRLRPGYPDAEYNLDRTLLAQGKVQESLERFRAFVLAHPDDGDAHHGLGLALAERGEAVEAQTELEQAVRLKPTDVEGHNDLGTVFVRQDKLGLATAQFQEAARIDPRDPDAHYNLGRLFAEQGKLAQAVTELEESLRLRPQSADVHNDLGIVLARMGRTAQAAAHFEEALRINPGLVIARKNLDLIRAGTSDRK
jgi:Flp pilus assembly protein TadD